MTDQEIMTVAKPYSMTAGDNLLATVAAVRYIDQHVAGDVVECGVWRGGHIIAAMLAAEQPRCYWLFDTFNGMTEPGPQDRRKGRHATESTKYRKKGPHNWCRAELSEVQDNIAQFQKPNQTVEYVIGPVEHTLRHTKLPHAIALLRLDTDFYSSTLVELETLWPRVAPGGVVIVDDFFSWDGCRQACQEFFGSEFQYQAINNKSIRLIKS